MAITGRAICPGGGGTAKRLEFTYTGDYTEREDGVVELRSSGTLTFLKDTIIDRFMVGGGAGGTTPSENSYSSTPYGLGGGGSGYTKTDLAVSILKQVPIEIVIGAGGSGARESAAIVGRAGGDTIWGRTVSVKGGDLYNGGNVSIGRNGGSGSAAGGRYSNTTSEWGNGGSDGGNGANSKYLNESTGVNVTRAGGTGQGTTTREFGEATGKLYAGGGGGGMYRANTATSIISLGGDGGGGNGAFYSTPTLYVEATDGQENTGSGGGGGTIGETNSRGLAGGNGGSGIVCIRLHKAA